MESSKRVMTKQKLDNKLADQKSSPCFSLKRHPSAVNNIVKFHEHKLLHNQMDRLTEVFDRINTTSQVRQCRSLNIISPISIEAEVKDSFPVMTEAEKLIYRGLMTGIEEDILLLDPNPEDITVQRFSITSRTIRIIEVTADSPAVTAHLDALLKGPELHVGHPLGTMTDALAGSQHPSCTKFSFVW